MPIAATVATITQKKKKAQQQQSPDRPPRPGSPSARRPPKQTGFFSQLLDFLNSTSFQFVLYLGFVLVFQTLSQTMRIDQEYYMDKHVMDRIIENRACRLFPNSSPFSPRPP